jgi:predicted acyltransferase
VQTPPRWQALDLLRGLSIFFMLLNLNPGAWEHMYPWLEHAKWAGGTFIDLVAPAFLFCIGAALPLSLRRRLANGASRPELIRHVAVRAAALVAIGLFLNAYPQFDLAHVRIPGVLQRIGVTYGLVASYVILTARPDGSVNGRAAGGAIAVILVSYFVLLQYVPVPGFGAPRYDPIGSWPAVIDRAVFTPAHLFPYWPVDGRVVFDPEGILSTWPACATLLFGVLAARSHLRNPGRPTLAPAFVGAGLMAIALVLHPVCPIIKNLWTPTFTLFTAGFSFAALGALDSAAQSPPLLLALRPAALLGTSALLVYMLSFVAAPLFDARLFPAPYDSIRHGLFTVFGRHAPPNTASFLAGMVLLGILFIPVLVCYRRRWVLKL